VIIFLGYSWSALAKCGKIRQRMIKIRASDVFNNIFCLIDIKRTATRVAKKTLDWKCITIAALLVSYWLTDFSPGFFNFQQ
jgi:hypothetical protein